MSEFPSGPISGEVTGWRAAYGVLKPYLPDLPSETIIQRSRNGVCLYCGQSWCAGCREVVREPTPALRADDV
jgi:hypothetical protein